MLVLKTTSPSTSPRAPKAPPVKTVPSSNASLAMSMGFEGCSPFSKAMKKTRQGPGSLARDAARSRSVYLAPARGDQPRSTPGRQRQGRQLDEDDAGRQRGGPR